MGRWRTLAAAAATTTLLAAMTVAVASPAGAVSTWSVVPTPSPLSAPPGTLRSVACPTTTSCHAVGSRDAGGIAKTLVESWNGTTWTIVTSPNPAGSTRSQLSGVACTSATNCLAVGSYDASGVTKTLVERWNGTTWTIVASPNPAGTSASELNGVACTSATNCVAVGVADPAGVTKPLVERWNGSTWTVVASPNPTGAAFSWLNGVTCTSASSCFAVGAYIGSGLVKTLIERWNGTAWTIVASPNPSGATTNQLYGVACNSTTSCFAVGSTDPLDVTRTLVERWNGSTWAVAVSPLPTGADSSWFNAAACTSATNCFAVGVYMAGGVLKTLVQQWTGTWAIVTSPNPTGSVNSQLAGVGCASTTSCVAAGRGGTGPATLIEQWNGTTWSIPTVPSGASNSRLAAVTCTSATSCVAVGSTVGAGVVKTLVESWNGTTWSVVTTPNPTGATGSRLTGVACTSATSCIAVGWYDTSTGQRTLVERWNGTSWTVAPSPNAVGADNSRLRGISCPSASTCFAVGGRDSNTTGTLVERWNGTGWTVIASANPTGTDSAELNGVACTSATNCIAVGSYDASGVRKVLVERWNGTAWAIPVTPNPTGSTGSQLNAVSCASGTSCVAVGGYTSAGVGKTLVEQWNGTGWAIVASPNPAGSAGSELNGVSCTSTTGCFAVGGYLSAGVGKTLTEQLSGATWAIVASPNPAGADNSALAGVRCTSATSCIAVGSYWGPKGQRTLVERYV